MKRFSFRSLFLSLCLIVGLFLQCPVYAEEMSAKSQANVVADLLKEKKLTVAVAESCTGGLVSSLLTDIPGSSQYVSFNAVTYSNEAKTKYLKVPAKFLKAHGPYNAETAAYMAAGIRKAAKADIGVSFTGLAGVSSYNSIPGGTVFIGFSGLSPKPVVKKLVLDAGLPRITHKQLFAQQGLVYLQQYISGQLVDGD